MNMKYIIGNWKMNPEKKDVAKELASDIKKISKAATLSSVQPIICPPVLFIDSLTQKGGGQLLYGAQDVSSVNDGKPTGEISASQLKNLGVKYVIVGHSERRALGETNEIISKKLTNIVKSGLVAILCVGEEKRDSSGAYFNEVASQVRESIHNFPIAKTSSLIIAYEPVWAVGENATRNASPRDFEEMAMLIRRTLAEQFIKSKAFEIPILYGGSVDKNNSNSYLIAGADGLLVGRASLKAKEFTSIIEKAIALNKK